MRREIEEFASSRWSIPRDKLHVLVERVHGGLESTVVRAIVAADPELQMVPRQFIVKRLGPSCWREGDTYEVLWSHMSDPPAARLLGVQSVGHARLLYLEDVHALSLWPWADTEMASAVCRALARLHEADTLPAAALAWNYEDELARSADETLALAERARYPDGARCWRRAGDLRRAVAQLPAIRERLAEGARAVIHGDVHPGNVILRRDPPLGVAFIDWGRARVGSPFEDVVSWLHSLGCWEPQARRRHDTLLRAYLAHRRAPWPLTARLREDYWLAGVSNGLSGAIRYHLAVVADPQTPDERRYASGRALTAWERVVRQASALLGTTAVRYN